MTTSIPVINVGDLETTRRFWPGALGVSRKGREDTRSDTREKEGGTPSHQLLTGDLERTGTEDTGDLLILTFSRTGGNPSHQLPGGGRTNHPKVTGETRGHPGVPRESQGFPTIRGQERGEKNRDLLIVRRMLDERTVLSGGPTVEGKERRKEQWKEVRIKGRIEGRIEGRK